MCFPTSTFRIIYYREIHCREMNSKYIANSVAIIMYKVRDLYIPVTIAVFQYDIKFYS